MSIGLKVGCRIVQKNTGLLIQNSVMSSGIPYSLQKIPIVLPRSNGYVLVCLFVNNELKTFGWHIQKSGVVLKTLYVETPPTENTFFFHYALANKHLLLLLFYRPMQSKGS